LLLFVAVEKCANFFRLIFLLIDEALGVADEG
jgi:hypothetical protein